MTHKPLGAGLGLKPQHFEAALASAAPGLWFEIHPENYMVDGGPRLAWLEALRAEHPLSVHSVSLSLAGSEPLDPDRLRRLAAFTRRFQPALVSEHLAWSAWQGQYIPDLLPFPRTTEALTHMAAHIDQMQTALGRTVAIENPTHYLQLPGHDWSEAEFLSELVRRTGCQLLLDLNNVLVSAHNLGHSPESYLNDYPLHAVAELHLAGYSTDPQWGDGLWIDSHDSPVAEATWDLLRWVVERVGPLPTLIERDGNVPAYDELWRERARADQWLQARKSAELAV